MVELEDYTLEITINVFSVFKKFSRNLEDVKKTNGQTSEDEYYNV